MIEPEIEHGETRGCNYPAPEHSFALRLDDELALRLTERHHAPGLYALVDADREHLRRWIPWTAHATPEWVDELVRDELERFGAGNGWRAELCFRGRPIGLVWLHGWGGAGGSTEVGYFVTTPYEGRGLVTRTLRSLIAHFFEERGVGRVAVGLDPRNERSLAVVHRLGLRPEAVLRRAILVDGEPADLSMFGLLREEFAADADSASSTVTAEVQGRRPPRFALRAAFGEEAYLAVLEREDAPALHRLVEANRERLARWLPWAAEPGLGAQESFIVDRALPAFVRGDGLELALWSEGRIVGAAGVHDVDPRARSGSMGYWVDAEHEGRGLVTKAVAALLDRCFTEPLLEGEPFERITVLAETDNARSRAVPERMGFAFEGVLRRHNAPGSPRDMAVYGLLRTEWESRIAAPADEESHPAPLT